MKVIIIGLMLLLFAVIFYITQQLDGFYDTNQCTSVLDPTLCANTADCTWDTTNKKCMRCDELLTCDTCASTDKCGWCTDTNKCVMSDRMGFPVGSACAEINYVVIRDLCPANRKAQPVLDVNSPLTTDQLDTGLPIQTYNNSACPDTNAIVTSVSDKVITLVKSELAKNGVKPIDGFRDISGHILTSQEVTIGNDVMVSVSDTIRRLVERSVKEKAKVTGGT